MSEFWILHCQGRGDKINGGFSFQMFLCALRVLCAKKILANTRDDEGLSCKELIDRNLYCSSFAIFVFFCQDQSAHLTAHWTRTENAKRPGVRNASSAFASNKRGKA
jgi:hypothetical protein